MEKLPKVIVIMSTYNGEKFLKEQIDSILAQEKVEVTLHVFDDCSKDNTVNIVKEYEKNNKNVFLHVNEKNKNFTYNFLDGMFMFKEEQGYDYYAFADQDDFWVKDKIISGINMIKQTGSCTLYCSNLKIVDGNLNDMGSTMMSEKYKNKHFDVACKNIVTGCTAIMDNDFKNLATEKYPENIYRHDYWLAIIANYTTGAHLVYDTNPNHILYRQHGNNQIGSEKGGKLSKLTKYAKKKVEENKTTRYLMKTYVELYGDKIIEEDKKIIEKFANTNKLKNRFSLFFKIRCNYSSVLKMKMLLNKY